MSQTFTPATAYNVSGGNNRVVVLTEDGAGPSTATFEHGYPWTPEFATFMPTSATFYDNQFTVISMTATKVVVQSLGVASSTCRMLLSRTRGD